MCSGGVSVTAGGGACCCFWCLDHNGLVLNLASQCPHRKTACCALLVAFVGLGDGVCGGGRGGRGEPAKRAA